MGSTELENDTKQDGPSLSGESAQAKKKGVFAKRLCKARSQRGLSQAELAALSGLQQPALSFYERGTRRPSFKNLRKLADALEVTADYLIGRTAKPGAIPAVDADTFEAYAQLSLSDRKIARELIFQLANRGSDMKRAAPRTSRTKTVASP